MAQSLSYKEAVAKGLVYPGQEDAALKLTGGGKGFADTEAYKKAFDTSYQAKKSEVDAITSQAKTYTNALNEHNKYMRGFSSTKKAGVKASYLNQANNVFRNIDITKGFYQQYNVGYAREVATNAIVNQINKLNDQAKGLSGTMEQAMAKYKATSEKAVETQQRETGAAKAARQRLTRGTAGLLAKSGGAGGMVGTGLPELGKGVSGGLGIDDQLGRKVKL